jgi:hypothetical protein
LRGRSAHSQSRVYINIVYRLVSFFLNWFRTNSFCHTQFCHSHRIVRAPAGRSAAAAYSDIRCGILWLRLRLWLRLFFILLCKTEKPLLAHLIQP